MPRSILLVDRADSAAAPGGDTVQIHALAAALREAGHAVTVENGTALRSATFDAAILFNLTRAEETWLQARACRARGIPYALFPVYWDLEAALPASAHVDGWARGALRALPGPLRDAAVSLGYRWRHGRSGAGGLPLCYSRARLNEETLAGARLICVNSKAEAAHLAERHAAARDPARVTVVPNGIWSARLPAAGGAARVRRVLCAGGLGPRKNQVGLVRAARGLDAEVWIAGRAAEGQARYEALARREAPANVRFLDWQAPEALWTLMRESAVYAQPSFIETPGLAALEAGALGCRLVLADTGPVREYFFEEAAYVRPEDPAAIHAGLREALASGPAPAETAQRLRRDYDWASCLKPFVERVPALYMAAEVK